MSPMSVVRLLPLLTDCRKYCCALRVLRSLVKTTIMSLINSVIKNPGTRETRASSLEHVASKTAVPKLPHGLCSIHLAGTNDVITSEKVSRQERHSLIFLRACSFSSSSAHTHKFFHPIHFMRDIPKSRALHLPSRKWCSHGKALHKSGSDLKVKKRGSTFRHACQKTCTHLHETFKKQGRPLHLPCRLWCFCGKTPHNPCSHLKTNYKRNMGRTCQSA